MSTTMENIKEMVDVNTVVGEPVNAGDGMTIIPISRVSFGFLAGGGEYSMDKQSSPGAPDDMPFAGGSGAGVSVNPMGFLVVGQGQVKMLPAQYFAPADRLIEMLPDLICEVKKAMGGKEKQPPKAEKKDVHHYRPEDSTTGMFVDGMNVPCEVCAETDPGMKTPEILAEQREARANNPDK